MLKWLKKFRKPATECPSPPETAKVVIPQWRNDLVVRLKSGKIINFWSETTDGKDDTIYTAWDEVLEWFEFRINKPYFRIIGKNFKTIIVRDDIASIMTETTKVK